MCKGRNYFQDKQERSGVCGNIFADMVIICL